MKQLTYRDLQNGDTFKLQPEGKMCQYDIYGHRCKDRRVYMKTNDGALEIVNCHGDECAEQNFRVYCYLSMPVYSVNVCIGD